MNSVIKSLLIVFLASGLIISCGGSGDSTSNNNVANTDPEPIAPEETDPAPVPDSETSSSPNILLIISDDQGLDASAQYSFSTDIPDTPTLDALANEGVVFDNMWATPACTTTRATIITGKYGVNSGVTFVPAKLSDEDIILQQFLKNNTLTQNYQSAVFGKWHLGGGNSVVTHPNDVGVDYYAGNISNVADYFDWELTVNGVTQASTEYHTSKITDLAIDWVADQSTPWFAWVAYSAPHSPFHLPPEELHQRNLTGTSDDISNNTRDYYLAAIEAMDTEIARLISSLDDETKNNTLIIFIGDNGTPTGVIDTAAFERSHGKGSLYQGGVGIPMIVSGKGVTRVNERETALATTTDLYATIAEAAGIDITQVNDSHSFYGLLSSDPVNTPNYIYTEFESDRTVGWAVRNEDYKLIQFDDGTQELYSFADGFTDSTNLLPTSDAVITAELTALVDIGENITGTQSSGVEDITNKILTNGSGNCADYVASYSSNVNDINNNVMFMGELMVSVNDDKCIFMTNAIPNHDFNDGGNAFPNDVSAQNDQFEITRSPVKAAQTTPLSLTVDNALMLNGVKVDLLAAGCFNVGDGKIGCNDINQPWRFDPMHPANGFGVDSHNAHAQPDGTYHYHGSPFALFSDDGQNESPVIGFAADGFPIFGSYFDDGSTIRKALSSYQLKSGDRPSGNDDPGGTYDGAYRDDYEYVESLGDLDSCNGMTVDGVYGYYITDNYPYVVGCFTGSPDVSFNKN